MSRVVHEKELLCFWLLILLSCTMTFHRGSIYTAIGVFCASVPDKYRSNGKSPRFSYDLAQCNLTWTDCNEINERSVLEKKKEGKKREEEKTGKWICRDIWVSIKLSFVSLSRATFPYDAVWSKEDTNHVKILISRTTEYFERAENAPRWNLMYLIDNWQGLQLSTRDTICIASTVNRTLTLSERKINPTDLIINSIPLVSIKGFQFSRL